MDEYRGRKRGSKKTFHGRYHIIDPARRVADSGASDTARPRRSRKSLYLSRPAHTRRGGRGPRRALKAADRRTVVILVLVVIAAVALGIFLTSRPSNAPTSAVPAVSMTLVGDSVPAPSTLEVENT